MAKPHKERDTLSPLLQTWGNITGLSRLQLKPLRAVMENRIGKKGAKKKDSDKGEAGRELEMFSEGVMGDNMDFYRGRAIS